ncbi:MAG: PorV/PorQ family protein [Candidatus Hydrogenedentota bacterium]
MFKIRFIIFLVMLYYTTTLFANGAGSTTCDFLLIDYSTKSSGMGSSYAGCFNHPDALIFNPAGLGFIRQNIFTASHLEYLAEMRYEYIAMVHKLYDDWNWGANIVYRGSDEVARDSKGRDIGEFVNRDIFATFGAGYPVNKYFSFGIAAKVIYQRLFDRNGWTFAVDGGMHLQKQWKNVKFITGLSLMNLGPDISYDGAEGPLPILWRVSFGLDFSIKKHQFLITQDSRIIKKNEPDFSFGIEYKPNNYFGCRIGFVGGKEMTDFNSPRIGFSFYQKYGTFDYSFRRLKGLDDIHQISYTIPFGKGRWLTEMEK